MRWEIPFGVVAIGVGVLVLYAAWANPPLDGGTLCSTAADHDVHVTGDWTVQYYNYCGGLYENFLLYFLGFTSVGFVLVGGGGATIREALR